jgi:hypothetical protein
MMKKLILRKKLTEAFLVLVGIKHLKRHQIFVSALTDLLLDGKRLRHDLKIENPDLIN